MTAPDPRWSSGTVTLGGARVDYDRRDGRPPPLLFVPGWCCPRTDWYAVADHLPGRSTATVDLPGQGSSGTGGATYDLAGHGRAVAAVVEALGWPEVTLVGHSMGGAVAVEAAVLLGPRIRQVICLDALTYEGYYARQDQASVRRELAPFEADLSAALHRLVAALGTDRSDPAVLDGIATTMASTARPVALSGLRALLEWDRDTALARCPAPVEVIAAEAFLDPGVAARLSDRVRITAVDLGGHFFLREDPAGTAAAIDAVTPSRPRPG